MPLLALLAALALAATPPKLSAKALALIAPVHAAFAKVEADQAKLPPPRDDREKLERLYDLDQAGRAAVGTIDFSVLPAGEHDAAIGAAWQEIDAHDQADQAVLKAMIARDGWITIPKFGAKASEAAFLIVQHAVNDPDFMRATLVLLAPLAARGEVKGGDFALMYDRVALEFDHKPQRYGSQVLCDHGVWKPERMEDPARVDDLRRSVGLMSEAEYLKLFATMPCS